MREDERKFKDEVVYSMDDVRSPSTTFCGQKIRGRCPCRRMRVYNNVLVDNMGDHFDQLWAKLGPAFKTMTEAELGVGGRHLLSTPPSRWANRMGTYQAHDWADDATREELHHFDGGASSIHFGAGLLILLA